MRSISVDTLKKYCTGCGLCSYLFSDEGVEMEMDGQGFLVPGFKEPAIQGDSANLLLKCCAGLNEKYPDTDKNYSGAISGEKLWMFTGHAEDAELRHRASSGGALSAYLCSLLQTGEVSFVAHIHADTDKPFRNVMRISSTAEDVINGCGSRYSPASPLSILGALRNQNGRGAIVGRPCDIRTLRRYLAATGDEIASKISLFVSFLCAGTPSEQASICLIKILGCECSDIAKMRYRGYGWPGNARLDLEDGSYRECSYEKAWGETLGRDIVPRCKYCFDGVAEAADVVFGDGWACRENGYPDFSDKPGVNVIIARTELGLKTMKECIRNGTITVDASVLADNHFAIMQPTHTMKRRYSLYRLAALRLHSHRYPIYNTGRLFALSIRGSVYRGLRQFVGALQRLHKEVRRK